MVEGLPDIAFRPALPELLRQAAGGFGDDDYVVFPYGRLSFAEAERQSRALAKRLVAAGVGKGTRLGIILPTGLDWVVAWLAAGRIGALAMLFPATYRPSELRRALRISDVAVLFASPTMLGKDYEAFLQDAIPTLAAHDAMRGALFDPDVPFLRSVWLVGQSDRPWATTVDVGPDVAEPAISDVLLEQIESEVSPADPFFAIYTSGSSADPKAVVHTHGATIRKMQGHLGVCLLGSFPGRSYCAMPFFWVGGPQDLLGALHSGAAIVAQERFDAEECLKLLESEQCTSIVGWPGLLEQIKNHPTFAVRDLSRLEIPQALMASSSKGDPVNMGMTETFGPHFNREWFDYKVIDRETGATLPDGEEGEFCVRGFGLMAGLYKQEREAVFDAEGWYHTGDRGYIEDTQIWFTGRLSEMVKSAGANVSPLEVEQTLLELDEVRMAFVMGIADADAGEVVAAVVVPAAGAALDTIHLAAYVNAKLSSYKVPKRWHLADDGAIPRLVSGKPDKRTMRTWFE